MSSHHLKLKIRDQQRKSHLYLCKDYCSLNPLSFFFFYKTSWAQCFASAFWTFWYQIKFYRLLWQARIIFSMFLSLDCVRPPEDKKSFWLFTSEICVTHAIVRTAQRRGHTRIMSDWVCALSTDSSILQSARTILNKTSNMPAKCMGHFDECTVAEIAVTGDVNIILFCASHLKKVFISLNLQ